MSIEKKVLEIVKNHEARIIEFRRDLHMHPETSFEEFRTTKRISEILTHHGIDHKMITPKGFTEPTGVVAEIKGGKPGKTVALRADIDALSMEDLKDVPYKSTYPGKMHACGHDAHTAVLMGAAVALAEIKDEIAGNIKFFFQPAEELVSGAPVLIENGCMEGVSNVFGMHVSPNLKTGQVGVIAGPVYAQASSLKVVFKGVGGHAAAPHVTKDAIIMASHFVTNVQTIVSRVVDPMVPAVVTFGKFSAGTRSNIIAHEAILEGSSRSFTVEGHDLIEETLRSYATHIAQMHGGSVEVEYKRGTPPVVNEEKSIELLRDVLTKNFGAESVAKGEVIMGAEDFSCYLAMAKGCFVNLGTGNEAKGTVVSPHHGMFDIDEDGLAFGSQIMCLYALGYLNQNEF
ncbi:MAG: amidohydrolase [Defluviitaleaceae bacterium]|nr:amidohydrolase [Defluviitaleaceae bacterium]